MTVLTVTKLGSKLTKAVAFEPRTPGAFSSYCSAKDRIEAIILQDPGIRCLPLPGRHQPACSQVPSTYLVEDMDTKRDCDELDMTAELLTCPSLQNDHSMLAHELSSYHVRSIP